MFSMSQCKPIDKYNYFNFKAWRRRPVITTKEMIKKVGCLCFISILAPICYLSSVKMTPVICLRYRLFICCLSILADVYTTVTNIDETISMEEIHTKIVSNLPCSTIYRLFNFSFGPWLCELCVALHGG